MLTRPMDIQLPTCLHNASARRTPLATASNTWFAGATQAAAANFGRQTAGSEPPALYHAGPAAGLWSTSHSRPDGKLFARDRVPTLKAEGASFSSFGPGGASLVSEGIVRTD